MSELLPCPFCGNSCAAKMTTASEMQDEEVDYTHTEAYAIICDASRPGGPGGCGAMGGFMLTEAEAIAKWNSRTLFGIETYRPASPSPIAPTPTKEIP